ncbi:SDR family NAD(P)-dependent oxidoreductase [Novosphingobium tardum]|jgi:NAD(P)-dependent dehydrogenase (short-subunit alcohol dehydrogenase family)|uniref:SDR family NAD(P)-dependent oxidoreductase n=1 Tax=Novosphingobium tardum TaxID=1538021 RepID=A0ABV8RRV8_9SPHN
MDLGLSGKKVIMNGGAHGLGLASLKHFAAEGADVAFFSRKEDKIEAAKKAISEAGSGKVHGEVFDMASGHDAYKDWLAKAADTLGGCDIFVHMASSSGTGGTGDWQKGLDMDIMGAALAVEVLTPRLAESGTGSIVFMSSTAAFETFIAPQPFNALKAALITYGSQLSQALAAQKIRVNTVSPGAIYYEGGNWETIKQHMPALYEATLAKMPMGRYGEPDEVAKAVVFVASPACPYMTGANLVIDGGFTQRVQF